jgi:hypothetical protein
MSKQLEKPSINRPIGTLTERNKPDTKRMAEGLLSIYARLGATKK